MGWNANDAYRLRISSPHIKVCRLPPAPLTLTTREALLPTLGIRQAAFTTSLLRMILRLRRHFTLQLTLKRCALSFTWRATERRPIPAPTPPPPANKIRAGAELTAKLSCLVSRWHCHQAASGCRALVQVLYFIERGCERKEGEGKNEGNRRRKVCRAWIKGFQQLTVCLTSRGSAKNDLLKGALWDMMRFLSGWQ